MKISLSLIQNFLDIDLPAKKIAEIMILLGLEVDAIENEKPSFSNVVVGKVLSVKKHPNADRLSIAEISDGSETFQVVCGALNCRKDLVVAFAKIGAQLKSEDGEVFKIKKSKFRDVDSYGMLCSASELDLFEETDGILELPDDFEIGKDLAKLLFDPIFEISLTPNLGHCTSAIGVARELAAYLNKKIQYPKPKTSISKNTSNIKVQIHNLNLCKRYCCALLENVQIAPSPFWLKKQLMQCGLKSVNNIVDITNFVMLELGQPMHAFDFDAIENSSIQVLENPKKQSVVALDGNEYTLPENTLIISDEKKPLAIAGVMGLENSSVHSNTTNILLEAALFDSISTRKTSKSLGLRTESSQRFEKEIDPNLPPIAINRAIELIQSLCPAKPYPIIEQKAKIKPKEILLRKKRVQSISGIAFSLNEIIQILQRLEFQTTSIDPETVKVCVPSFRNDIHLEIDLIEEIIRIYGYNQIELKPSFYSSTKMTHSPIFLFENFVRNKLLEQNLQEVLNADLVSPELANVFQESDLRPRNYIEVMHSKSAEYSILRPSLLAPLLQNIQYNLDRKNQDLSFFEIGRVHFHEKTTYVEQTLAAIALTGKAEPAFWEQQKKNVDFFDLKGILENLFETIHLEKYRFIHSEHSNFHPTRQANIFIDDENIGVIGELHLDLLTKMDIKQKVFFSEINLQSLLKLKKDRFKIDNLPQYPSSERDWTLTLQKSIPISHIQDTIDEFRPHILETVTILDLYETSELKDQKNVTLRFVYRDQMRTLSYEEVEDIHNCLKEKISKHLKIAKPI